MADPTTDAVERFNEAFNNHDVDAVMAAMTDDCVFESTSPPLGERHEGQAAVRAAWEAFFASSPTAHFDTEEMITTGDRCVVRWAYTWDDDAGAYLPFALNIFTLEGERMSDVTCYIVRSIEDPSRERMIRMPENAMDASRLTAAFGNFGLPERLD